MAEYIEQSVEEMLPELEQMERVGLFNSKEIRQIIKKRTVYEYKLRRRTKMKDDYLQYIQYETNLLALVKKRRERTGYNFKKHEIDSTIIQRIHRLYKLAEFRFPSDLKLWMTNIAFCQKRNEKALVSRLYTKMLQVHDKKPELWLAAAKWEFEENQNAENARSLLQRALRFNPDSQQLWLEYFRYELLFAEKMRKRKKILGETIAEEEEVSDAVLNGQVAFVVFKQALEAIPDNVSFIKSFIPICQLFDFTNSQEEEMFQLLRDSFPNEAMTWDAIARRNLGRVKKSAKGEMGAEMEFHKVYEEAVNTIPSEEIWSLYINGCLELLQQDQNSKQLKVKRLQRTLLVMEEAKTAGHLSAGLWEKWVDLLCDTGNIDDALEVVTTATACHSGIASLWRKRLTVQASVNGPISDLHDTLKEAQKKIPKRECWPLIEFVIQHSIGAGYDGLTVMLLEDAMSRGGETSARAMEMYLEYSYLNHGITHARKIYSRVTQSKSVSLQFYRSYISMEKSQSNMKMKLIRQAFEEALRNYGKTEPDLWMDYIRTESKPPKGKPENVGKIHFRAVKTLTGSANQDFIRKYTLLQTSGE